jgi:hypothetical protein
MKNLVLILILAIGLVSCKKEDITPGNYHQTSQTQDTSNWQSNYGNGGTLPTWGNGNTTNNQLFGTNWVLTDVYNNYAHTAKSDTVHFISNTKYTVGSNPTQYTYNLYSTTGNWSMTLNTFMPINGLTLSCSNFNANVFATCPIGGTIQLNLKDNFSNTNNLYVSTFKKI